MIRRPPRSTRVRSSAASDVYKRQILCIQETNIDPQKHSAVSVSNYLSFHNPCVGLGSGTAILVKNNVVAQNSTNLIPGKLQKIELTIQGTVFNLFNIHFPFLKKDSMHFLNVLQREVDVITDKSTIILMGDFNFVLDDRMDRVRSIENRKRIASDFSQILSKYVLTDLY